MQILLDAPQIELILADLADKILADPLFHHAPSPSSPAVTTLPLALVGIRSRGEILAQRLAKLLASRNPSAPPIDVGALDITMYRDDLSSATSGRRRALTIPQGTDMNFRLDDRPVLLVDDVLATGRSVRAALDALVDFGRPKLIRLAVLIDRGRREFPIHAEYVGHPVPAAQQHQNVIVHLKPTDPEDGVYLS